MWRQIGEILRGGDCSAFMDRTARTLLQQSGGGGSETTSGTRGAHSPSRSHSRVRPLSALLKDSVAMPYGSGPEISVSSLVLKRGEPVAGCICTPYSAASRDRTTGRLVILQVHKTWCAAIPCGGGGAITTAARRSSPMTQNGGQLPMFPSTSQKRSESTNVTTFGR